MPTRVRSHAKINLGLAIGPTRPDGYHALATIYQTLAIHDFVEVTATQLREGFDSQIVIHCDDVRVPCDQRNTCWKIVDLALRRLKIAAKVDVHIEKQLPVQGGLGAGSANAAAALIGLEKELNLALPEAERLEIAAKTGSDVPLFLIGGTVLGLGRGEEVHPLLDLPDTECVLAVPEVAVSTPRAFAEWDGLQQSQVSESRPPFDSPSARSGQAFDRLRASSGVPASRELTGNAGSDRLKQLGRAWRAALTAPRESSAIATGVFPEKDRAGNLLLELVRAGIENDFESVVFSEYPSLRGILETLKNGSVKESSAIYAGLSGSGSTLFGLYRSRSDAGAAVERLAGAGIQTLVTKTIGRREYWRNMMNPDLESETLR